MKTEYLFVILLVLIGFSSCEDSTSDATHLNYPNQLLKTSAVTGLL